jgi:hypothetical protein
MSGLDDLMLSFSGQTVEGHTIPSFDLHSGDYLCLHLAAFSFTLGPKLAEALTKESRKPVSFAERPTAPHSFLTRIFPETVGEWFVRTTGADRRRMFGVLAGMGVSEGTKVSQAQGTVRALLGVEAAFVRSPIVIFSTDGLDPTGMEAVFDAVSSRRGGGGAIYLSYPPSQGVRLCPTGARCLSTSSTEQQS